MAIALLAKLRNLHTAAIQYPYVVLTLLRIIAMSLHTYVSHTIRLEPALTYLRIDNQQCIHIHLPHLHL